MHFLVAYVYDVTLTTGNKFGAGTDANVFVRFIGEKGSTDEIQLQTNKLDLERGMINTYQCSVDDVGHLKKVIVRHDNSGIAPAWFLEKLQVKDSKGKIYYFECNSWLEKVEISDPILLLKESENSTSSHIAKKVHRRPTLKMQSQEPFSRRDETDTMEEVAIDDSFKNVIKSIVEDNTNDYSDENTVAGEQDMKSHKKELHNPAEETSDKHKTSLSPAVRNLVDSYGIDFFKLSGTGPHSRVLKGDVIKYMQKFNMKEKVWRKRKTELSLPSAPKLNQSNQSASTFMMEAKYTDCPLSATESEKAASIAHNKFASPHVYGGVKCDVTHFNEYVEVLSEQYHQMTSTLLLVRVFADVIFKNRTLLNFKVPSMNVYVCSSGEEFTLQDCTNNTMDQLYEQAQEKRTTENSMFGVNVMYSDGVMQLSSVLPPGQLVNISFSSLPLTLDSKGIPRHLCLIAMTSDGSHVTEEEMALLLDSMKQMIEQPAVM